MIVKSSANDTRAMRGQLKRRTRNNPWRNMLKSPFKHFDMQKKFDRQITLGKRPIWILTLLLYFNLLLILNLKRTVDWLLSIKRLCKWTYLGYCSSSKGCKFSRSEYTLSLQCLTELTDDANGNKTCKYAWLLFLGRLRLNMLIYFREGFMCIQRYQLSHMQ